MHLLVCSNSVYFSCFGMVCCNYILKNVTSLYSFFANLVVMSCSIIFWNGQCQKFGGNCFRDKELLESPSYFFVIKATRCTNFTNLFSHETLKFVKLVRLVGFLTKKFVTMHGHMNVKVPVINLGHVEK